MIRATSIFRYLGACRCLRPRPSSAFGIRRRARSGGKRKRWAHKLAWVKLAELYSVLTRAPFTPPIYPAEAWQLIEQNILSRCELVTLDAAEVTAMLRECASQGWVGGRVYDAVHIRCAMKIAFDRLYTLNARHFQELAPAEMRSRIVAP